MGSGVPVHKVPPMASWGPHDLPSPQKPGLGLWQEQAWAAGSSQGTAVTFQRHRWVRKVQAEKCHGELPSAGHAAGAPRGPASCILLILQHPSSCCTPRSRELRVALQSHHGQAPLLGFALSRSPRSPSRCLSFLRGGEESDNQPGHQESSWTRLKANQRRKIMAWFMSS